MKKLLATFLIIHCFAFGWSHLELGAGNYGRDGHTQISQSKTVLMALSYISGDPCYVDDIPKEGTGDYSPDEQYFVLFWTLDKLVSRYGERGTFYVNDLIPEYATYAAECLQDYANLKGYLEVEIVPLPGDYQMLSGIYDSVHLKNPEISFFYSIMEGHSFYTSDEKIKQTRALLQQLANLSFEGLYLFILEKFIPTQEKDILLQTSEWENVPYVYPEGMIVSRESSLVYFIPRSSDALDR